MSKLIKRIEDMIMPILNEMDLHLIRVSLTGNKQKRLQVMIERKDLAQLTMEQCVAANQEISNLLDIEDPIESAYRLEVTSAGMDRPLMCAADYQRFLGSRIYVRLAGFSAKQSLQGILQAADQNGCTLQIHQKQDEDTVHVLFENIAHAHLDPSDEDYKKLMKGKATL